MIRRVEWSTLAEDDLVNIPGVDAATDIAAARMGKHEATRNVCRAVSGRPSRLAGWAGNH